MLAGERYNCLDPQLEMKRQQAFARLWQHNLTADATERHAILRQLLGEIGDSSLIQPPFYCSYGRHITIGAHVFLNFGCTILDNAAVVIGDHVMIGPNVQIYTAAHPLEAIERNDGWENAYPVTVEENVWIGGGAILLPGVTVGRNAVVGAGAVVTRAVAANTVVAGNPARVIRTIEQ
ncbi:MAG: sugar O-acetyltransferase [Anaerolineae bacterium]